MFIIVTGAIGSGLYAYNVIIPRAIQTGMIESLQKIGFTNVVYERITRKKGRVIFYKVSLDQKSFSGIEKLTVHYSLWNYLFGNKLAESLEVKSLKLNGAISNDITIAIDGWKNDGGLISTLFSIPSERLIFQDASVELLVPEIGGIKLEFEGEISRGSGDELQIDGMVKTSQKKLDAQVKISGTINSKGNLEITSQSENFKIESDNITARRARLNANIVAFSDSIPSMNVQASAGSILWYGLPLQDTNITLEKDQKNIQFYAEGKTPGTRAIEFSVQSKSSGEQFTYEASIYPESIKDLNTYLLSSGHLPKDSLFPESLLASLKPQIFMDGTFDSQGFVQGTFKMSSSLSDYEILGDYKINKLNNGVSGNLYIPRSFVMTDDKNKMTLSGNGKFNYSYELDTPKLDWNLQTRIEKSEVTLDGLELKDVEGRIDLASAHQELNENQDVVFKLPLRSDILHEGVATLIPLNNQNLPLIKKTRLSLFGGSFETGALAINNGNLPNKLNIEIGDVSLTDFFAALGISNISILGKIAGNIPMEKVGNRYHIKKGLIQSQQSGLIQIPEEISILYFPLQDEKSVKIRKSLKDFHYEFFEIRLDGEFNGPVMMSILANGINPKEPDLEGVQNLDFKFEFNLRDLFSRLLPATKN